MLQPEDLCRSPFGKMVLVLMRRDEWVASVDPSGRKNAWQMGQKALAHASGERVEMSRVLSPGFPAVAWFRLAILQGVAKHLGLLPPESPNEGKDTSSMKLRPLRKRNLEEHQRPCQVQTHFDKYPTGKARAVDARAPVLQHREYFAEDRTITGGTQ